MLKLQQHYIAATELKLKLKTAIEYECLRLCSCHHRHRCEQVNSLTFGNSNFSFYKSLEEKESNKEKKETNVVENNRRKVKIKNKPDVSECLN